MTHLVQLLLPLYDRHGKPFPAGLYEHVEQELTGRFGGITAYARAPAKGLWAKSPGHTTRDDIVVYEVMVEELDSSWWSQYRLDLEQRFGQEELVVRAQQIERI
jgi:hypothetical protein